MPDEYKIDAMVRKHFTPKVKKQVDQCVKAPEHQRSKLMNKFKLHPHVRIFVDPEYHALLRQKEIYEKWTDAHMKKFGGFIHRIVDLKNE